MNPNKPLIIASSLLLAASQLAAENMVFNSGFELGEPSCQLLRYLRPDTNPELKYLSPTIDSSTSASGRQSLKIANPFAEQGNLIIDDFKLEPGKEYTLSFAAKAEAESCPVNVYLISSGPGDWNWDTKGKKFEIGKDWKTCEFTFKPKDGWTQPYYNLHMRFAQGKDPKPGAIWLDNLQLEAGSKRTPWQPAAEVEAWSKAEKNVITMPADGAQTAITTCIVNNSDKPKTAAITLRIVEDLAGSIKAKVDGRSSEIAKATVTLAPRENKKIESQVKLSKYGAFRLETAVDSDAKTASSPDYFVVVPPVERKLVDLDKAFCASINFAGCGQLQPPHYGEVEYPSHRATMDQDKFIQSLADLGIRAFRDWDNGQPTLAWEFVEKEQGKFDFSLADKVLAQTSKHGIQLLPVLGAGIIVDKKTGKTRLPEWLDKLCRTEEKSGEWGPTVKIPPTELWRKYVRAVAKHFKGRFSHYEIINEPNGYLRPEVYIELLKAASEEIRAADPNAKIVAFCSTGDNGGNLTGFIGECFKRGGLAYSDIVSFHPYSAANLGSVVPTDKQIDELKELLAKANAKAKPCWNTEIYYLTGASSDKGLFQPKDAAQRFLTDLGEGVGQSMAISGPVGMKRLHSNMLDVGSNRDTSRPSGALSVYSSLTMLFEGAKPVAKFKWGCDTICYVYERNGKRIAAFWSFGEMKDVKAQLPANDANMQLYDIFGNKLSLPQEPLLITAEPMYLEQKNGMSAEAFTNLLKNVKAETATPLAAGQARLIPANGWTLLLPVRSYSWSELKGSATAQAEWIAGSASANFAIKAGEEKPIAIPLELKNTSTAEGSVEIKADGKNWTFQIRPQPISKIAYVSAQKGEAEKIKSIASFTANYDEKFLHLEFDVKDSQPSGEPGKREPWEQDCIEVFIDAAPSIMPMKAPSKYTDKVARLFIIPYAQSGAQLRIWPKGLSKLTSSSIKLELKTTPAGYSAKLDIPLEALELSKPLAGKCIGFEACIDNSDGGKSMTKESWNSSSDAFRNRFNFGFLVFK